MIKKILLLVILLSILYCSITFARIRDKWEPQKKGDSQFVTKREVEDYFKSARKRLYDLTAFNITEERVKDRYALQVKAKRTQYEERINTTKDYATWSNIYSN